MPDEPTNPTDTPGEEHDKTVPKPEEPDKVDNAISPLDRAEAANKEKEKLLAREEKLMDRKEKILAEEKVGGRALAGKSQTPKEESPKEYRERVEKEMREGKKEW